MDESDPSRIWHKPADVDRTERLIAYLQQHPQDRIALCGGDFIEDAKAEQRQTFKPKFAKKEAAARVAEAVFAVDRDPEIRRKYSENKKKWAQKIEDRITA